MAISLHFVHCCVCRYYMPTSNNHGAPTFCCTAALLRTKWEWTGWKQQSRCAHTFCMEPNLYIIISTERQNVGVRLCAHRISSRRNSSLDDGNGWHGAVSRVWVRIPSSIFALAHTHTQSAICKVCDGVLQCGWPRAPRNDVMRCDAVHIVLCCVCSPVCNIRQCESHACMLHRIGYIYRVADK